MNQFKLIGRKAETVNFFLDYWQITFADRSILNIFNKIKEENSKIYLVSGLILEKIIDEKDELCLVWSDDLCLRVGLSEIDYVGPEAMEFIASDGQRIIWN